MMKMTQKIENVIHDEKTTAEDGKSCPEGHRSLIVGQEPYLIKPDHEKYPHVQ